MPFKSVKVYVSVAILCFLFLLMAYVHGDGELKPFETDGCSSFPDGTYEQKSLWYNCCEAHDFAYWKGGTYAERLTADEDLKECVSKLNQPEIAQIMLLGVRVGGAPWFPTQFRWGYGWPYPRWYGELSFEELEQVNKLSDKIPLKPKAGKTIIEKAP